MDTNGQTELPILVGCEREAELYVLRWSDGYTGQYPYVWLRDNCRCSSCYYPSSRQRSVMLSDVDVEMEAEREELSDGGHELKVFWPDNHVSTFPSHWLHRHRFNKTEFDPVKKIVPKPWGAAEMIDNIPKFDYQKVMEDPGTLRKWLRSLIVTGLALLTGAPKETGVIEAIGRRVGHLRTTMYGHTFQVVAIASSSNLAYTSKALGLHVDLPLYDFPPSVQMLHCIKQCETVGGVSQYCDAMKVARDIRRDQPNFYETLTKVKLDIRLRGEDYVPFHFQFAKPAIILDEEGNFTAVSHNNGVRAPYMNIPAEDVKQVYQSLAYFDRKLYDKENLIEYKLREGDVVTFNNNRVMHGRSSFKLAEAGEEGEKTRHLEGGYIDWDIINSRLRLLEEEIDHMAIL